MKNYGIKNLRNIGFIGHGGVGKTSLVEALLYNCNIIDRLGNVEDGTTVCDYDSEEKKRGISISLSLAPIEVNGIKINLVDIPGYFDFYGESIQGMRAVDVATIVVSGVSGVKVGTEKAFEYCNKIKLSRTFFINKLDRENSDFDRTLKSLKETFGISVVPIQYPIGKEGEFRGVINVISNKARIYNEKNKKMEEAEIPKELLKKIDECKKMIMEAVAETSEELLDKYFSEGVLSDEEIYNGLLDGCAKGEIAPVMCGSAIKAIGMNCLLEDIIECFPSPELALAQKCERENGDTDYIFLKDEEPTSAFVFKTVSDPFVGKMSFFRVITGRVSGGSELFNVNKGEKEKIANLFFMRGKSQIPTSEVIAGDIGVISKLQWTETGDTLSEANYKIKYDKLNFKEPMLSMAVIPKDKRDEEKITFALNKLSQEDKTLRVRRDIENAELVLSGVGETHLEVIAAKIKSKFSVDVELREPKIPYRETIKGTADVQGKHKKQSGGHGQYGDVKIKFERRHDGIDELEFIDKVVGGAVPRNFIPAVEKGLLDSIKKGVIGGYPVIGLKATLYDGSYHPVDSSEMAFKIAASIAYKKGMELAKPVLLEPIMKVTIYIPDEYLGDIMGDINKRRGRVLGMEVSEKGQKVIAEAPMAEMFKYPTDLRSMTGGRGDFFMEFERYEETIK